jgi:hypothetical protein
MKIIKTVLHYWFAIASVFSFLLGWGMLAHSLKPVQPQSSNASYNITLPQLPPIQAFGSGNGAGVDFSASNNLAQSGSFFRPRLRSGGS